MQLRRRTKSYRKPFAKALQMAIDHPLVRPPCRNHRLFALLSASDALQALVFGTVLGRECPDIRG